ncbi:MULTISPECIES: YbhB/YbcL family Raf kinase inhibitor-like protein [unclassified Herbaspirillum]|uniref:YbhB/YbcL family Raf kinase inhibitor-like protein n=1 Tax=unclassified Herbaspirillum TaxID=2624150 RepID=UPI000E2F410A|nr:MULTISPECIES: YbhB/YbcL family Raf kinase inhibitor-like protein [unclassified Herbaspirillum]RFB67197.1 YbhB/YbcL family Raf kinase inhibitor-like protein [Herbaspirillum sp. 3R-3a1]TFI06239.1 YbhB/YbcL family Raf kinase inhibitor-like protein [Herbaspirillum sp. 3R11]TFI14149.1 YbhB/YbcL family Raf kinase inhibitor-like protein [Herbaspirillum sp. 3R-11]TFI27927.1 YbhB/YbcL family Raf kinase inhibitor-like protein [Herbaspirillum sp. 3C11]
MKLWSDSFQDGAVIPGEFAFAVSDPKNHVALSSNKNPHLAWSDLPPGTKSLVLVVHDPDVPSRGDDVNQEGKTVPADLPRVDFFHWTLVDIPAGVAELAAGQFSSAVTTRGKAGPAIPGDPLSGARHGLNDYTSWFAGDGDMSGDYFGYDGPCPPWNDAIAHRYIFTLYAIDQEQLTVTGKFTGTDVHNALQGHVLAQAAITGTYTLNPDLIK